MWCHKKYTHLFLYQKKRRRNSKGEKKEEDGLKKACKRSHKANTQRNMKVAPSHLMAKFLISSDYLLLMKEKKIKRA